MGGPRLSRKDRFMSRGRIQSKYLRKHGQVSCFDTPRRIRFLWACHRVIESLHTQNASRERLQCRILRQRAFSAKRRFFSRKRNRICFTSVIWLRRSAVRNAVQKKLLWAKTLRRNLRSSAIIAESTIRFLFSQRSAAQCCAKSAIRPHVRGLGLPDRCPIQMFAAKH